MPVIVEKRPKAWRRCLSCDKRIKTTAASRICKTCSARNVALETGTLVMMTTRTRSGP